MRAQQLQQVPGCGRQRICALNLVAALREATDGDLNKISKCVRIGAFTRVTAEFAPIGEILDDAFDLIEAVFGPDLGAPARTVISVMQLPLNSAVTLATIFAANEAA